MAHRPGDVKKIRQRLHAKRRALRRYGLVLTTKDLKEMAGLIMAKPRREATRLLVADERITLWALNFRGMRIPVAFDSASKTIASILPRRALTRYQEKK